MALSTGDYIVNPQTAELVHTSTGVFGVNSYETCDQWTNTNDVAYAHFVLYADYNYVTPSEPCFVELHTRLMNIVSTNDQPALGGYPWSARRYHLGNFVCPVYGVNGAYYMPLQNGPVFLPAVGSQQVHEFTLRNVANPSASIEIGMKLYIIPFSWKEAA